MTDTRMIHCDLIEIGGITHGWKVTGPLGTVAYRILDNVLRFEPVWAQHADADAGYTAPVDAAALAGRTAELWALLRRWYESFPQPPAGVPTTVEQWRQLRGKELVDAQTRAPWFAWEDDTDMIGGWSVMPYNAPPSCGVPPVGWFMGETISRLIAAGHNETLTEGDQ